MTVFRRLNGNLRRPKFAPSIQSSQMTVFRRQNGNPRRPNDGNAIG